MCLAIPGQVIGPAAHADLAVVDVSGVRRTINVGLLDGEGVAAGDWVLIHVGFAMSKIDEVEARATLAFLEQMGQAWRDEMDALAASPDP